MFLLVQLNKKNNNKVGIRLPTPKYNRYLPKFYSKVYLLFIFPVRNTVRKWKFFGVTCFWHTLKAHYNDTYI